MTTVIDWNSFQVETPAAACSGQVDGAARPVTASSLTISSRVRRALYYTAVSLKWRLLSKFRLYPNNNNNDSCKNDCKLLGL